MSSEENSFCSCCDGSVAPDNWYCTHCGADLRSKGLPVEANVSEEEQELTIEEIRAKHPDKWVLIRATRRRNGQPIAAVVLAESDERRTVDKLERQEQLRVPGRDDLYTFYTGSVVPDGWSVALVN